MLVPPHLKPKVTLGQKTVYQNQNGTRKEKVYQGLRPTFYRNSSGLQPFLNQLKGRILTNQMILSAPTGVYTWILKRGNVHISPLRTNQEIGSLHANMDMLTATEEDMGDKREKPEAAGEMLIVNDRGGQGQVRQIFYNLQSGTFSEPLFSCRARTLGEQRGMNKKELRKRIGDLKMECRQPLLQEVEPKLLQAIGLTPPQLRFLDCSPEMDRILEEIPFLQGRFDHGPCKDEDGYVELLAGKNLIRRLNLTSSLENVGVFDTYFTEEVPSSKRKSNQIAVGPIPIPNVLPSKVGKTMGGRRTRFRKKRSGYKKSRKNLK
jgi:hypothetical protein